MVFPVVMYECESWSIEKAEGQRINAFELWCWRRLLRVPGTARRSSQSILKEISPEYSLEGLLLKLKLQYFGYLMRRTNSLEKTLMLGKTEDGRRRGQQRMGFPREEYWSEFPFPSSGDLSHPGIKPASSPAMNHLTWPLKRQLVADSY